MDETTLPARFWAKVEKTDTCWNWAAGRNSHGYGTYYQDGQSRA